MYQLQNFYCIFCRAMMNQIPCHSQRPKYIFEDKIFIIKSMNNICWRSSLICSHLEIQEYELVQTSLAENKVCFSSAISTLSARRTPNAWAAKALISVKIQSSQPAIHEAVETLLGKEGFRAAIVWPPLINSAANATAPLSSNLHFNCA